MSHSPSEHDPFASPHSIGAEYSSRPGEVSPPSGAVTAVAVLNYMMGPLHLLGGALVLGLAMVPTKQDIHDRLGITLGALIMVSGVVVFLAGYGIQERARWGRILTIVLAGLSSTLALFHLINLTPLTIVYGGYTMYTLVILLQEKHAEEFA